MKLLVVNGSPRKNGNTARLLKKAIEGAKSNNAEVELVNLYDLNYKGCISCFACKKKDSEHGICAMKDDLSSFLIKVKECDALIIGSPIYFDNITSGMRGFLERLFFSNMLYTKQNSQIFPKKLPVGLIYTMNISENFFEEMKLEPIFNSTEKRIIRAFGSLEKIYSYETYQFNDYSKYEADMFDEKARKKIREEIFPVDCQKAFDLGKKLTTS